MNLESLSILAMDEFRPWIDALIKFIMDEWLFLFGGSFFFLFILALFYWLYNRNDESEFDTRYPRATLDLFEPKKKQQQQQAAAKKNKKKADKSPVVEQPDAQRPSVSATQNAPATTSAPTQSKQQQKTPSQPEQPAKAEKSVAGQAVEAVEPAQQVKAVEPLQAEPPKELKKAPQQQRPINSSDLDQKKVMAYLSKKGDIDAAYISWLTATFQNHETQLNHRKTETQSLDKKNRDLAQRNEKLLKDKQAADNRAKEEQNQRLSVAAKLQALQNRETELVRQNQASQAALQHRDQEHAKELGNIRNRNQQLEGEVPSLRNNLNKTNTSLRAAQQIAKDATQHLEEQARKHKSIVSAYDADKKKTSDSVAELNKVVAYCEQELAKTGDEFVAQAQQINSLTTANKELENALQAAQLALANQSKHSHEDVARLEEEQKKWQAEKEEITKNYESLKAIITELNGDMAQFHSYKDQQEKIVSDLNQREQSRLEELAKEKEQSEAKEADLLKQLMDTKQMLSEVRKNLEEEQARVVEIPKNAESVEEVFELKKTTSDLAAAPSTSSNALVEELKAKNAQLDEKNMELRQRNMTILEKTEAVPNLLVNARKQVVKELGRLTKKAFKSFNDEEAFHDWLNEAVSEIQQDLFSRETDVTIFEDVPAASAHKSPKATSGSQNVTAGNEQVCRNALISLIKELDHINKLVDKQEREHKEEVARLKAQLS